MTCPHHHPSGVIAVTREGDHLTCRICGANLGSQVDIAYANPRPLTSSVTRTMTPAEVAELHATGKIPKL